MHTTHTLPRSNATKAHATATLTAHIGTTTYANGTLNADKTLHLDPPSSSTSYKARWLRKQHLHTEAPRPMVQEPWYSNLLKPQQPPHAATT